MEKGEGPDWSILHTVEEMQRLSNFGHRVEGILLLLVALIAFAEATKMCNLKLSWPWVILVAGLFLVAFLLLHHGLGNLKLVWSLILADAQQRQHLFMATLLIIAGVAEIIFRARGVTILQFMWPLVIISIGVMFLTHEQHGTGEAVALARKIHQYLGILLMLVGLFIILNIFL